MFNIIGDTCILGSSRYFKSARGLVCKQHKRAYHGILLVADMRGICILLASIHRVQLEFKGRVSGGIKLVTTLSYSVHQRTLEDGG